MNKNTNTNVLDGHKVPSTLITVLDNYYHDITNKQFVLYLAELFSQTNPYIIKVGRCKTLIYPKYGFAMSENTQRLLDYLSITKRHHILDNVLEVVSLSKEQAEVQCRFLKALGSIQMPKEMFLWHVYSTVLEQQVPYSGHKLPLKLRYMPNVALMGQLPQYTKAIFSTCLTEAKTILQIQDVLSVVDKNTVNRLFLLLTLSGIADLAVIEHAIIIESKKSQHEENLAQVEAQKNQEVTKAKSTGFFKRLLEKLSW